MSRLLFLFFTFLSLCSPALSQEEDDGIYMLDTLQLGTYDNPFVAGIMLGGNTGTMSNDRFSGFHNVGYSAGLTVYIRLFPHLWVNSEILYVKKGCTGVRSSESVYWGTYFEKYYLKMSYAEVPVIFHLFQKPWYHLSFGASYSRYLNSKESLYTSPVPIFIDQEKFYFNKNNFDYIIGGGLHINKKLYLNIRYQGSITRVRDAYRVHPYVGAGNQYATTCSVQLMYMFRTIAK